MSSNNELNASQTMQYGTIFSAESIKVMAESAGYNALSDDAAKELAEDVSIKLKRTVQDALKFMKHSRRERLSTTDIDAALRVRNLVPQFGFTNKDFVPFRFASGGGRELHFNDEHEIELNDSMPNALNLKLPLDISLRAHWLAVDGIQPLIPENPPPSSKEEQALESVNPVVKLEQGITIETAGKPIAGKIHKYRNVEPVHVKQLATHELSVEQQLYYKQITEACVGSDESRRGEALQSLSADPGLHEMLPRMCTFIAEGVKVNVVQNNLALLIYLMRMVKALLDNAALYLEKYLHELIPSVNTCIVSRQLCMRPELDNHWALRDFASRLMAQMCKNFNTPTNNLQTRVTRIFSKSLINDKTHLSSLYGSLAGLAELGGEVVKVIIIPRLRFISDRIESILLGMSQSNTDKTAAGHIRSLLQKNCPPIIRQIRASPDVVEDYRNDYGFLGPSFCTAVMKLRNTSAAPSSTSTTPISSGPITSAAQSATGRPSQMPARQTAQLVAAMPRIIQPSPNQPKYVVVSQSIQLSPQLQQPQIKRTRTTSPPITTTTPTSPQSIFITMHNNNSNINNLSNNNENSNSSKSKNNWINNNKIIVDSIDGDFVNNSNNDNTTTITATTSSNRGFLQERESVIEDVEMVIVDSEDVRPPPELDDLSHLE